MKPERDEYYHRLKTEIGIRSGFELCRFNERCHTATALILSRDFVIPPNVIGWLSDRQSVSSMTSVFQLGVGLNLVVMGYADRRLGLEARIEQDIENNIEGLHTLHSHFDRVISSSRSDKAGYDRSEVDSSISKKWDVIQLGVISSKVNDNYLARRNSFHASDVTYQRIMPIVAVLCCIGLFISSLAPSIQLSNMFLTALGLLAILPAIIRFYITSRQTSVYRRFTVGERPPPSPKLETRKARVHRTIENEAKNFAEYLKRSPGGFRADSRYAAVAQEQNPTALYFVSGQIKARLKTLQDTSRA